MPAPSRDLYRIRRMSRWMAVMIILALGAQACSLPIPRLPSGTPGPTPTKTSAGIREGNLPPVLVESDPPSGSQLPMHWKLTLTFDQAMEKSTVEGALRGSPGLSGRFAWVDERTVTFTPDQPSQPGVDQEIVLEATARSAKGLPLQDAVTLSYTVAGYLQLAQSLPKGNTREVDPSSAVVASFNQPVVALGAEAASLPPAFSLNPAARGRGEWLNTSTYIFYPTPALAGGKSFTVKLNPALKSTAGTPLDPKSETEWTFTTASPRVVALEPDGKKPVPLDAIFKITFDQPMDPASVQAHFSLTSSKGDAVGGSFDWQQDDTVAVFKPSGLLSRGTMYILAISADAQAAGGTPLGNPYRASLPSIPDLTVISWRAPETVLNIGTMNLRFSGPLKADDFTQRLHFEPQVANLSTYLNRDDNTLGISGFFQPSTDYTLTLSADLSDPWGQKLGKPFVLRFRTPSARPDLRVSASYSGGLFTYLTPRDAGLEAQAVNLKQVDVTVAGISFSDLIDFIGDNGYDRVQQFSPSHPVSFNRALNLGPDRSQTVTVPLTADGRPLAPGLYWASIQSPDLHSAGETALSPLVLVVSPLNLVFKVSASDALVWAVNLETNAPAANADVRVYDQNGNLLAKGQTDKNGLFQSQIPTQQDAYRTFAAVIGQPGQPGFGLALSSWHQGISGWEFDLPGDLRGPRDMAYGYTDRPIYRPGQTVYFRAVVRHADNGRYSLPDRSQVRAEIYGAGGPDGKVQLLASFDLPLSAFGTAHSEYDLPEDARPGDYFISLPGLDGAILPFTVAEYRKPQIDLQAQVAPSGALQGGSLHASIQARYFFGAPAGNLAVHWTLTQKPDPFFLPDAAVGALNASWLSLDEAAAHLINPYGVPIEQGDSRTAPDGSLTFDLAAPQNLKSAQALTLEVTASDDSGLPVSARAEARVHPSRIYIGVKPDTWSVQAGSELGFEVRTVDWSSQPVADQALHGDFLKAVWKVDQSLLAYPGGSPRYKLETQPVASADLRTGADGRARLAFTPPDPGIYLLDVSGQGAQTQLLLWVGGPGQPVWPEMPDQRLQISPDAASYQPGQTARIFVPNPFPGGARALLSVERGRVMRTQIVELPAGGSSLPVALQAEDAPNVFVSLTLLARGADGRPDFRQGYTELAVVDASAEQLKVELSAEPDKAAPGDTVTLTARVSDQDGKPVQGEFSLALVDKAVLALKNPYETDIASALYGRQPLGVLTGLSLAGHGNRGILPEGGGFGGGGGEGAALPTTSVREKFSDTAFWQADIVTGADGTASVRVPLPDSLTTWQALLRGTSQDTRVGEAKTELVASKDLQVQPVAPRFLVAGDHAELAALVHNQTATALSTQVSLNAAGFSLDDPSQATQTVNLPAGGRARVAWWGSAQFVDQIDLVFTATAVSGGQTLHDAARPEINPIPVLHYSAPNTFATAGVLSGGERLEVVAMPASYQPTGGQLDVELSPSLAASMVAGLEALDHPRYETVEGLLSSFLPNLEAYRVLKDLGLDSPALKSRLETNVKAALSRLQNAQNADGGWGWIAGGKSDPFISAYAVFGLNRARGSFEVKGDVLRRGTLYLGTKLSDPRSLHQSWELDQQAFYNFALAEAGAGNPRSAEDLFAFRDQLSPWAKALFALTEESFSPGGGEGRTLLSDLEASALRSATGAHWESSQIYWQYPSTPIFNTAVAVYALARLDPASPLLPDAVRYLMDHRSADGGWGNGYETAWVTLGLAQTLKGTGDLNASFVFSASLNNRPLVSGQAGGPEALTPVRASADWSDLLKDAPNALRIRHEAGDGKLYYRAALRLERPAETAAPLDRGLSISRAYYPAGQDCRIKPCAPIQSASLGGAVGPQPILVRLTLTVPHDVYYVQVEDFIPAGAEVVNPELKTSQQAAAGEAEAMRYDPRNPYANGWGGWLFGQPAVYDDHLAWGADYLPAGTYELAYVLAPLQAGEFRLLPARAWMTYFPEVQGTSAGAIFTIRP